MLKTEFYEAVQTKYPTVKLARALYKIDKEFTAMSLLSYKDYTPLEISKYLISTFYTDCFYYEKLGVDSEDKNINVSLSIYKQKGRAKKLTLKQTISYGCLALHYLSSTNNLYKYKEIIDKYFKEWRPYLWEKVELLLD